jgi:predicted phosphoribosyltransferase
MNESARFKDRRDAARRLARVLDRYRARNPLVLGIPRGGVVMAEILARELGGDLDVALVRKLRAPGYSELAVGSVTEHGLVVMNEGWEGFLSESYLRTEIQEALDVLRKRRQAFTPHAAPIPPAGRLAIVVDDGIATGATMIAALRSLRKSGAERLVAAAAVAPASSIEALRGEADEVVCLRTPEPFTAVSPHFEDFSEVTDEEVLGLLRGWSGRRDAPVAGSLPLHHGNFGLHPQRGSS